MASSDSFVILSTISFDPPNYLPSLVFTLKCICRWQSSLLSVFVFLDLMGQVFRVFSEASLHCSSSHFLNLSSFEFILFNTGNQTQMQYSNIPNDTLAHSFNISSYLQEITSFDTARPAHLFQFVFFYNYLTLIYLYKTTLRKSFSPLPVNEL